MTNGMISKIIWFVLLMVQFVYAFVTHINHGEFLVSVESAEMGFLFIVLASMSFLMSFALPASLLKNVLAGSFSEAVQRFFVPHVLRLIMLETVVIFGMVLSFSNEKNYILPFLVFSVLGFLLSYPSDRRIKKSTGFMR
jgi:hypothetical protein